MSDLAPSRSVILDLRDERQTMAEGHAFLDEKCLLLAGEIVRELQRYDAERERIDALAVMAAAALQAALARHGLEELSVLQAPDLATASVARQWRSVMGVKLAQASLAAPGVAPVPAPWSSPEAVACREEFAAFMAAATVLGGVAGNLERLSQEYRRSIRRARALNDVLMPELDRTVGELETQLEDLEREDAISMRLGAS
ncbi:MAG: V-type ATP synthase subunit D [Usitatibacter sp.]